MIRDKEFKDAVVFPITTLREFVAGQMFVCWFFLKQAHLYTSRKNLSQFSSVILAVGAADKASCAFIQTECIHVNLVLTLIFIKSLSGDFVSLFLLKMSWIWERNAVTKDRWPPEDCYYYSNLSHSAPLIKADITLMCFLWEALDVPGCLSNRKAIFFAYSRECVLTHKLITKRSHVYAKWHGRRSKTVGFLGLAGSMFFMAPGKQ